MNLKLFGVILVRTLGQIDRKEQLRGGFVPYKRFLLMFSATQELCSDSSSHFEGWLYDPIILGLLRDCTSESTDPRPHFQELQCRFCACLIFATLLFFIVLITKPNIYYHYYTFMTISFQSKLLNELNIMKLKLYVHIMPSGRFTLGLECEIF